MIRKLPKGKARFFRESDQMTGKIGRKPPLPAAVRNRETSRRPMANRPAALILADQFLNLLGGYARRRSRARSDYYQRDLNWIADVLIRIEAREPNPLRPWGE